MNTFWKVFTFLSVLGVLNDLLLPCSVLVRSGSALILVGWIRILLGKIYPQKNKKVDKCIFEVLDVLFCEV
jgi:hypothetical protein